MMKYFRCINFLFLALFALISISCDPDQDPSYIELIEIPRSKDVRQGAGVDFNIQISRTNYTDPVTLTVGQIPQTLNVLFDPNPSTGNSTKLSVETSANIPVGVYNIGLNADAPVFTFGALGPPNEVQLKVRPCGFRWIKQFGSNDFDTAFVNKLSSSNNIYILGRFFGVPVIGKYENDGRWRWFQSQLPGFSVTAMDVDPQGNLYIAGTATPQTGGRKFWVAKYFNSGFQDWVNYFDDALLGDSISDLYLDDAQNIYISGSTLGSLGRTNPAEGNNWDSFLVKFNSQGTKQWLIQWGEFGHDFASNVVVDSSGNIYVRGESLSAPFIAKFSPTGSQVWSKNVAQETNVPPPYFGDGGLAIDSNNNIYLTTHPIPIQNGLDFTDPKLTKFDNQGVLVWVQDLKSNGIKRPFGLTVDNANDVYISGIDGSNTSSTIASVAKYDGNGNFISNRQLDSGSDDFAFDVEVDTNGNIYVSGNTQGSLATNNGGGYDGWLAKFALIDCVDSDDDGIIDDGDESGSTTDSPCTGGNIRECDDNCVNVANSDQADSNNNSVGDACEND